MLRGHAWLGCSVLVQGTQEALEISQLQSSFHK